MSKSTNLIIVMSADEQQSRVFIAGASTVDEWQDKMLAVVLKDNTTFRFSRDSSRFADDLIAWGKSE